MPAVRKPLAAPTASAVSFSVSRRYSPPNATETGPAQVEKGSPTMFAAKVA
ncbi:MAG: hypothetical protein WDN44_10800 [Sphingomonas sp.]